MIDELVLAPDDKREKMISLINEYAIKVLEPDAEASRLAIYEETKNMTPEQYTERVRKIGEAAAKKYGFKIVASANENNTRETQGE